MNAEAAQERETRVHKGVGRGRRMMASAQRGRVTSAFEARGSYGLGGSAKSRATCMRTPVRAEA